MASYSCRLSTCLIPSSFERSREVLNADERRWGMFEANYANGREFGSEAILIPDNSRNFASSNPFFICVHLRLKSGRQKRTRNLRCGKSDHGYDFQAVRCSGRNDPDVVERRLLVVPAERKNADQLLQLAHRP